ncbi:hypothetical protein Rsub_10743 [Raphidocelis subcapitata]|uniref:K Homology domain-containing protein n=1 Tax=Raphidocelis subcapitata TaxID=307507 RepID=A0A2V0PJW8_9CHLO|nr:hypothetical protein Rsub_10743 [Raphidocelis subcapitata]|eukprot:GBF97607.1 hypothetical protein Rsub_10743 [Raphidocelis subcapitata]
MQAADDLIFRLGPTHAGMDVPSALASITPLVDPSTGRPAVAGYHAAAAGAGSGRATPPAPGVVGGLGGPADTCGHRDQQHGVAAPAGAGGAAGRFAAFASSAHEAAVAALYAPPPCNPSAPPAGMRANGGGASSGGAGGGGPLRGSPFQQQPNDLPEATPAPLSDPGEALMLATYLRLVRETHGSEAAAAAAASSAVTLSDGSSAGLGLLGLHGGAAAAALRSLSRPSSRPSSRPASADAVGVHHASSLMPHGGGSGPVGGELPYAADLAAGHDGGAPGGGDELVSSMLGFIRDRKLATINPPQRRPNGDSSASSSSSGGNRSSTMKIWIQPSGPRRPGEGTEDEEQGILTAEEVPASGDVMLRITLLAAGFVIGPAGASVREIMRRTGADIKSWTEATSGAKHRRPARIFLIGGDRRSMAQAIYVVTAAVDRYKELCEGKYSGQAVPRVQRVLGVEFAYQPPPKSTVPYAASLKGTHVGLPSQRQQAPWPVWPGRGGPRPPGAPPGRPPPGGRGGGMPPLYPFGHQQPQYGSDQAAAAAAYAAMLSSGMMPQLHPAMAAAADPATAAALHAMAMAGGFGGAMLPPMAAPDDAFGGFAIPTSAAPLFPHFGGGAHDANAAAAAAAVAAAASFAASGAGGFGDYGGYGAQHLSGAAGGGQQAGGGYRPRAAGDALLDAAAAAAAATGLPVPIPGPPTELGAGRLAAAGSSAEFAPPPRTPPTAGRPTSAASAEGGANSGNGHPSTPRARAGNSHGGGGGNGFGGHHAQPVPAWARPRGPQVSAGPPSPLRPMFAHPASPAGPVPPLLGPMPLLGGIFPVMPGTLAFGPLPGMGAFSPMPVPPSPVRMLKSRAGVVPVVEVNGCTFFPTPPSPAAAPPPPVDAGAMGGGGAPSGGAGGSRGGLHPLQLLEDNPYLCQEAIGAPRSGFGGQRPPSHHHHHHHHGGHAARASPSAGYGYESDPPAPFDDASGGAGDYSPPPAQQAAGDVDSPHAAGGGSPFLPAADDDAPALAEQQAPSPAAALAAEHGDGAAAAYDAAEGGGDAAFDADVLKGRGDDQDQGPAGDAAAAQSRANAGAAMGAIPEEAPYPQQPPGGGSPPRAGTPSGGNATPRRAAGPGGGDAALRARLMSSDPMVSPGRLTLASKIKSARLTSSHRIAANVGAGAIPAGNNGGGARGAARQALDFGAEASAGAGAGGDGGSPAAGNHA